MGFVAAAEAGGSDCRGQARSRASALAFMRHDGRGGCAASWPTRRETAGPRGRQPPISSSCSRPLVSTRQASPRIDEAARAQSIDELLQALAGRREDEPKEPALTQLCEP
jgi:hypothetical protein